MAGTTLLRRYFVKAGQWDEFLGVWRQIVSVRRRYGFAILFALQDREKNIFTWAIHHEGDIDEVATRYYADPERVQLRHVTDYLESWDITRVEPVSFP